MAIENLPQSEATSCQFPRHLRRKRSASASRSSGAMALATVPQMMPLAAHRESCRTMDTMAAWR